MSATATPAAAQPGRAAAAAMSAADCGDITVLRGQIDALDEAIARLVAERARLSRRTQAVRMSAGGTRVELGRERQIRDAYRSRVGPEGPALADAVLQVCRGRR